MNINFTLVSQMAWFFAFVWFTARFVWPPLMRAIDERQQKIADGLAAAERGQQDLVSAQGRVDDLLRSAKQQSQDIVAGAQKRADEMVEEAKGRASEEAAKIIAAARAEAEQESVKARETLRDQVAGLAVKGAEAILKREVNAGVHAELLSRLKTEL